MDLQGIIDVPKDGGIAKDHYCSLQGNSDPIQQRRKSIFLGGMREEVAYFRNIDL